VSAPGKPSPLCLPLFSAISSVLSYRTPPISPCAVPRALPEPIATPRPEGLSPSPPLSSGAIDHASELRLSVIYPPRFDSAPGTVSGRCIEVHGCFLWISSHELSSRRPSLAEPRHTPASRASAARYASCGHRRGLSTTSASGHAVPGDAPSLGSTFVHSLAVGYPPVNCHEVILHVMYCACTCRVLLIDGDRLHGITLPYIILVSCIIFTTRTAMRS
jgi:hypothetical protein